jgi:hypothetical protein
MTPSIEAIHEAAHAVMAVLANVPFEYVTTEPGTVDGMMIGGHIMLTGDGDPGYKAAVSAAARVWDSLKNTVVPGAYGVDDAELNRLAEEMGYTVLDVYVWKDRVFSTVETLLEDSEISNAVYAVALKLDEQKRITSEQVKALVPVAICLSGRS